MAVHMTSASSANIVFGNPSKLTGATALTIAVTVRPDNFSGGLRVIQQWANTATGTANFIFGPNSSGQWATFIAGGLTSFSNIMSQITTASPIAAGQLGRFVTRWKASTSIDIWCNGVKLATTTSSGTGSGPSSLPNQGGIATLQLGFESAEATGSLNGQFSELAMYTEFLPDELCQAYGYGVSPSAFIRTNSAVFYCPLRDVKRLTNWYTKSTQILPNVATPTITSNGATQAPHPYVMQSRQVTPQDTRYSRLPIFLGGPVAVSFAARITASAKSRPSPNFQALLKSRVTAEAKAKASGVSKAPLSARVTAKATVTSVFTKFAQLFARITGQSKAMQAVPPVFSSSGLWRTDVTPDANSTYVEGKEPMEWLYQTVLLPDNLVMAMNMVVESNLSMSFLGSEPTVSIEAADTNEVSIADLSIPSPGTDTLWNDFKWNGAPWNGTATNLSPWRLAWTEPLVFKQMTISASGTSETGFQIGNLYLKYQPLGYRQQLKSGVR